MREFEKHVATINRLMRCLFLSAVLLVFVSGFLNDMTTATTGYVSHSDSYIQGSSPRQSLQLAANVVSQQYCSKTRPDSSSESQLALQLKLSVRNTSEVALIVPRFNNAVYRVVLSKSLEKTKSGNYAYDAHSTLMRIRWPENEDWKQLSPTSEFVILKPNDSFDYQYLQGIEISLTDPDDGRHRLPAGRYFLQVKIQTWPWDAEKINVLQQRWAQYGHLWYHDIASEPLLVSIEKPASISTVCK